MKLLKKFITKSKRDTFITIDTSDIEGYSPSPYYDGVFTVRNITPETSDDLFYFFPGINMIPGYVSANSEKTLNLINNKKKLVFSIVNSYYHSVLDNMSEIIYTMALHPKNELIIDVSELDSYFRRINDNYHAPFLYFLEVLESRNIKYRVVNLKQYDVVYINNFRVIAYPFETAQKAELVYEFFKPELSNIKALPTKNVFVSRSKTVGREYDAPGLSHKNDNRMDSHQKLEEYFRSLGYEVVNTEDFSSFKEQIEYFYQAKVIASITGSGLTNAAFMRPGQTLIEIVTPLVVPVARPGETKDITDPYYVQEIHNFYKNLAFYKDHSYFAIHNESRSFDELKSKIEKDPRIKMFLDRSND